MTKKKLEPISKITVTIASEAEEALAAAMESIFDESPTIYASAETQRSAVTVFLKKTPAALEKLVPQVRSALKVISGCGLDTGRERIEVSRVPAEDWSESWKKYFKTIEVGSALIIKPSWSKQRPRKGQAVVVLDPGLSFGTGQHATTSFCLHELVRARKPNRQQSLLDIGSGSGILGIAAAKLGYDPVVAFDFDPKAVAIAQKNFRANRVKFNVARKDLSKLPQSSRSKYNVICANLMADLLIDQRAKIMNRLAPSGTLILAGILATQFKDVQKAYENLGLVLTKSRIEREWQSGSFSQRPQL